MYREDDTLGPVRNYYSLTKLVAEQIARSRPEFLVIRTSFRPREWPYPVAFADVYTSQDYVDVIAPEIVLAIQRHRDIPYNVVHIAETERKSVYELARRRKSDVQPGTKRDAKVELPDDISLDISRWQGLKKSWSLGNVWIMECPHPLPSPVATGEGDRGVQSPGSVLGDAHPAFGLSSSARVVLGRASPMGWC